MRDELTEGRRYPEEPHPYRSEYQRDRDRIVHTKAFRRLENKTQVFDPDYSDHFRNRLTHTIEVSQITRTISEALGLNTDLVPEMREPKRLRETTLRSPAQASQGRGR